MRTVYIQSKPGARSFRVVGTGRWASFGDAWMATHDLMHHAPTDSGRIEQEIQSFGVEQWIEESRRAPASCICWSQIGGALAEGYKDTRNLDEFVVPPAPAVTGELPSGYRARFEDQVMQGFAEAASTIESRFLELFERSMAQAELDKFVGEENQARAVDWLAYGYLSAQSRYPDKVAAALFFDRLSRFFDSTANCRFQRFGMDIDESRGTVVPHHASLRKTWDKVLLEVR